MYDDEQYVICDCTDGPCAAICDECEYGIITTIWLFSAIERVIADRRTRRSRAETRGLILSRATLASDKACADAIFDMLWPKEGAS